MSFKRWCNSWKCLAVFEYIEFGLTMYWNCLPFLDNSAHFMYVKKCTNSIYQRSKIKFYWKWIRQWNSKSSTTTFLGIWRPLMLQFLVTIDHISAILELAASWWSWYCCLVVLLLAFASALFRTSFFFSYLA